MFKRNSYKRKMRKMSRRETLERDGFKLAYGLSIIMIGILSIYFECPRSVIVGVAISALVFSFIDTLSPRRGFLHFFTIRVLLMILIFPNMKGLEEILKPKWYDLILCISFGCIFLIQSISTYKWILKSKRKSYEYLVDTSNLVAHQFDNYKVLLNNLNKMKSYMKDSTHKEEIEKIMINAQDFIQNEYILNKTKYDLSLKGQEDVKEMFTLKEVEFALQNTKVEESKEIPKKKSTPKKKEKKK